MQRFFFSLCMLCIPFFIINAQKIENAGMDKMIDKDFIHLEQLYQHLHQYPELSFLEKNTAIKLAGELREAGFEVTENVGGTGVVGVLKNGEGPVIMVRTDLDALPILEETGADYASKVRMVDITEKEVPVMHACGHDMHMTVWTGAARLLAKMKEKWKGTLVFIGQPAEERGGGAKAMLNDGLYEKFPHPDYVLALHVSPTIAAGDVGYCSGYAMANVDMMDITVYGEGGHGAYPHTTIDPVMLAAKIIVDIQTIVSREVAPIDPAVVTVGSIHGGTKGNVIPNEVKMELTLRSYSDEVRAMLIDQIKLKCKAAAMAAGLHEDKYPLVKVRDEFTPALYNNPELTSRIVGMFNATFGAENVVEIDPVMGGEDFARYGRTDAKVPILMFRLGSVEAELIEEAEKTGKTLPSLHTSTYLPVVEPTVKTGVKAMSLAILELLGE